MNFDFNMVIQILSMAALISGSYFRMASKLNTTNAGMESNRNALEAIKGQMKEDLANVKEDVAEVKVETKEINKCIHNGLTSRTVETETAIKGLCKSVDTITNQVNTITEHVQAIDERCVQRCWDGVERRQKGKS